MTPKEIEMKTMKQIKGIILNLSMSCADTNLCLQKKEEYEELYIGCARRNTTKSEK
jgi:hypothetical protein